MSTKEWERTTVARLGHDDQPPISTISPKNLAHRNSGVLRPYSDNENLTLAPHIDVPQKIDLRNHEKKMTAEQQKALKKPVS